jgi:hypothetical protein
VCGDVIAQECQRLPAPNLPSNASIGLDNHYFFLFFFLSLHTFVLVLSTVFYFFPFPFPSSLFLVPLSSHPFLISGLVFFPLSANIRFPVSSVFYTQRYSHRKSMKVKAEVFFSAKSQYLSIQKATLNKKYECFIAVSSDMTCYFSVCSEDSAHTQLNHSTSQ